MELFYNIHYLKLLAKSKVGECFSVSYQIKYKLKSKEGNTRLSLNICSNKYSQNYIRNKIKSHTDIKELQNFALSKGGKCLSTEYKGITNKHQWQCNEGHTWDSLISRAKNKWCPHCFRSQAISITKDIKDNNTTKELKEAPIKKSRKKSSTPYIKKTKEYIHLQNTIEDMNKLASAKGGKCLSNTYKHIITMYEWQCSEGHIWQEKWYGIKRGRWCPVCRKLKLN